MNYQMTYLGTWNAVSNTPTLPDLPTNFNNSYYLVTTPGTQFGISFLPGDWIVAAGDSWSKISSSNLTYSTGTAAFQNLGIFPNNVVQLDVMGNLPPPISSGNTTLTDPVSSLPNSLQSTVNNLYNAAIKYVTTPSVLINADQINAEYLIAAPPSAGRIRISNFSIQGTGYFNSDIQICSYNGATVVDTLVTIYHVTLNNAGLTDTAVTAYNYPVAPAAKPAALSFANGWNQYLPAGYSLKLVPVGLGVGSGEGYMSFSYDIQF